MRAWRDERRQAEGKTSVQMMTVTAAGKIRCGTEQLNVGYAVALEAGEPVAAAAAASETARAVERTNSMSRWQMEN